ncbi:MAG: DUF4158 domain-containing protein [Pseudomonadota bacterium]
MKQNWNRSELRECWTLNTQEMKMVQAKSGKTRLGFAVLLKYFLYAKKFPEAEELIALSVLKFLACQLGKDELTFYHYDFTAETAKLHRRQVRLHCGFRTPTAQDAQNLTDWLTAEILPIKNYNPRTIRTMVYNYFQERKIEPFSIKQINRFINSASQEFERHLFEKISSRLTESQKAALDVLVKKREDNNQTEELSFFDLKQGPGKASLNTILIETQKLKKLREIGTSPDLFSGISAQIIKQYSLRTEAETPKEIRSHLPSKRHALLAIYSHNRSMQITDDLIDIFNKLIHKVRTKSERSVREQLLPELTKVNGKPTFLLKIAQATTKQPAGVVEEVIFPIVSQELLQRIIAEDEAQGNYQTRVHKAMSSSYKRHYRRMLKPVLEVLELCCNNPTHQPILKGLQIIKQHLDSKSAYYPEECIFPIKDIMSEAEENIIQDNSGKIKRLDYEMVVLEILRRHLRCKNIWSPGADRYRNPDEDLYSC